MNCYIKPTMSQVKPEKIQFKLAFDVDLDAYLRSSYPEVSDYHILSKSLDARGAPRGKKPIYLYIIAVKYEGECFTREGESFKEDLKLSSTPIIIGAGPAGLFSALRFSEYGIPSIIIERGTSATQRMLFISKYWKKGILNTESNVCNGEGGAGLFSDGKLITRIKSPFIKYVMNKFVDFGAPEETAYISNPHLGSNKIRKIITKISDHLREKGSVIHYDLRVDELLYNEENDQVTGVLLSNGEKLYSDYIILGTGHSAKEMYYHLEKNKVAMEQKDFAVGVRVEHPRATIDQIQHGKFFDSEELGAARYRLSYHNHKSEKGTYSFCMCPGGYVLSSGTEADGIVVNGMSNYARNSRWSNSALVVTVHQGVDFPKSEVLSGLELQHEIERKAFDVSKRDAGGKELPAMYIEEFLAGKLSDKELPKTSSPSGIFKADLSEILPSFVIEHLREGLEAFDKKMKGFSTSEAILIAPETRTSAPVTISRDRKTYESLSHKGLYPCGEGAGYAGGITSAAVDGIRVTESILSALKSE